MRTDLEPSEVPTMFDSMFDSPVRKGLLLAICALGFAGCVAETPVDGPDTDAEASLLDDGGAGGAGGGRYTADAGPDAPTADAGEPDTCEVPCRPTGVCPGTQVCLLVGCCGALTEPVVEHFAIGRGMGVLMVQATILDTSFDAETVVITVGETVHSQTLQYTVAERTELKFPVFTDALADEAQVYVRDREGLQSATVTVPIDYLPIRRPTASCDPSGYESWCGPAGICLSTDDQQTGRCYAANARLWTGDQENLWLDVWAGAPAEIEPAINAFTVGGQLVSPAYIEQPAGWRFLGRFWDTGADAEVRYQAHLLRAPERPEAPEARSVGEACDAERVADRCPADTACLEGVCATISAPVLGAVNAVWQDGALALRFEGSDAESDIVSYIIVFDTNDRGRHDGRFGQRRTDSGVSVDSGIDVAATRFVAWYSMAVPVRPTSLRVQVIDAEGLASAMLEVPVTDATPQSPTGSLGWRCDPQGLISACEPSLSCTADVWDGSARCRQGYGRCPDLNSVDLAFIDGIAELDNETADSVNAYDDDPLSCVQGASGRTRYYRLEAPLTGRYRASVLTEWGGPFHIAARPFCNLTQELACAGATAEANAQFEVDLTAGQPLTIAFMASWSRSMSAPYTLRVEVLP